MKKRLPQTFKQLEIQLADCYSRGYAEGKAVAEMKAASAEEVYKKTRRAVHLEALRSVQGLASVVGQTIGEVAKAMQSEKDQL